MLLFCFLTRTAAAFDLLSPSCDLPVLLNLLCIHLLTDQWSDRSDVFALGYLRLMLISKRRYPEEDGEDSNDPVAWAYEAYGLMDIERGSQRGQLVFVHESLSSDSDYCVADGRKVTKLAMQCMNSYPSFRPSMQSLVRELSKLQVVKQHCNYVEVGIPE